MCRSRRNISGYTMIYSTPKEGIFDSFAFPADDLNFCVGSTHCGGKGERDRQTDRQTDRETDRETMLYKQSRWIALLPTDLLGFSFVCFVLFVCRWLFCCCCCCFCLCVFVSLQLVGFVQAFLSFKYDNDSIKQNVRMSEMVFIYRNEWMFACFVCFFVCLFVCFCFE